jgi:hypothetical protein
VLIVIVVKSIEALGVQNAVVPVELGPWHS